MAPERCMCRSPPFGMRLRKAWSSRGLCLAVLKARVVRCSFAVAVETEFFEADEAVGRDDVWAKATMARESRSEADAAVRMLKSIGVLAVRVMRKDSARGVSWRYGGRLLYLRCVCVAGSQPATAPLKRPGRQM